MARFNRLFFDGLQRLFPSAGVEAPYPREISDTVNWTKDLTARGFHNNIRLRRDVQASGGTGITLQMTHPEPDQGFFQVPVSYTLWSDAAVDTNCEVQMIATGNPVDPWGAFDTLTRSLSPEIIPPTAAGAFWAMRTARVVIPMTRGFQWRTIFFSSVIGRFYRAHVYWIDVPGDIISIEDFTRQVNIT